MACCCQPMQTRSNHTPKAGAALFCAALLSGALLSSAATAAPPTAQRPDVDTPAAPRARSAPASAPKLSQGQEPVRERAARQRRGARAKAAGPPGRLIASGGPQLLRVRVVDHHGPNQREFRLEILVNQEGSASLETEIGKQRYELSVSPDHGSGKFRISLRRRGDDGFSISTRVDPSRPGLVARSRSDSSRTEIFIAPR